MIWCLMTAACGLSRNFVQLFLARVGVGVGEATLNPSALSMISDYFPRERRGRAISFYNMGVSLGAGTAMILGGWVIASVMEAPPFKVPFFGLLQPWQTVFLLVGLPGLLIAVLMATVKEPVRRGKIRLRTETGEMTETLSIRQTIRWLTDRWRTFGSHFLGMSVVTVIGYGFFFWVPTMFMRTWDWSIPRISISYGIVNLVFGPLGVMAGGWLADRWYRSGTKDGHMRLCLIATLLMVPAATLVPLMPSAELAVVMLIPMTLGAATVTAAGVSALMMITPNQLRAQTTALYYFVINVIGLSVGGAVVGFVTDYVFGDPAAIRYTLSSVSAVAGCIAFGLLAYNLRLYKRAVVEAEEWQ